MKDEKKKAEEEKPKEKKPIRTIKQIWDEMYKDNF